MPTTRKTYKSTDIISYMEKDSAVKYIGRLCYVFDSNEGYLEGINEGEFTLKGYLRQVYMDEDNASFPFVITSSMEDRVDTEGLVYSYILPVDDAKENGEKEEGSEPSEEKKEEAVPQVEEKDYTKQIKMIGLWWSGLEVKTQTVRYNSDSFKSEATELFKRGYTLEEICDEDTLVALVTPTDGKYVIWDYFSQLRGLECEAEVRAKRMASEPDKVPETKTEPKPAPVTASAPAASSGSSDGLKLLEMALANTIVSDIKTDIQSQFETFIKETYGTLPTKIVMVEPDGKKREVIGVFHDKYPDVLKIVEKKLPVYLEGPAGTGKNVLCKQIAEALGLEFYFSNAVTNEFTIKGFTNANGVYQPSQFYEAFTKGGLFMLDEMDASIPDVLVMMNSAIANRYFDFPAPIGRVEAHPDFRVIAAGNTSGTGASSLYTGRSVIDGASLDRFIHIYMDYDKRIEETVADGDKELLEFARALRKAVDKLSYNMTVSYRGIKNCHLTENILGVKGAVYASFFKGADESDVKLLLSEMKCRAGNRFYDAVA